MGQRRSRSTTGVPEVLTFLKANPSTPKIRGGKNGNFSSRCSGSKLSGLMMNPKSLATLAAISPLLQWVNSSKDARILRSAWRSGPAPWCTVR